MKKEWSKISLIFFFLVAVIGTWLRSAAFVSIPLEYSHLVHAHSHVAFQGWVYTIIFLLLTHVFLKEEQLKKGRYPLQYQLTIVVVVGVLISFSLQGYALYSIIFSTLFQLLNYWFIYRFLKDVKVASKKTVSLHFIKTGLWLGILSTLMPYGIGVLSAKGLNGTEIYQSLVYVFLHLQYNGWFLFVVLGLFFQFLDSNNIGYHQKHAALFYRLLSLAVIPAIALSLLGMSFSRYFIPAAYLAALLLGAALLYFLKALPRNFLASIQQKSNWFKLYFIAFVISFVLKMILQCLSVLPLFNSYAFGNKHIIIAYIHLSLIGSISFLFLALMVEKKWLPITWLVKIGSVLLISGFAITELMLIFDGFNIYHNPITLIAGSMAMAIGILLMVIAKILPTKNEQH